MKKHSITIFLFVLAPIICNSQDWKKELVNQLADSLSKLYVFPTKGLAMANFIRSNFKNNKYESLSKEDLAGKLESDLRSIVDDRHLKIYYGRPSRPSNTRDIPFYPLGMGESKILSNSNIGYLEITGFKAPNDNLKKHLTNQLNRIKNCEGLIIDLRNNGGGSPEGVQLLASHFFNNDTTVLLNEIDYPGYGLNYKYHVLSDEQLDTDRLVGMPIYILTSNYTFSAGEGFAYLMKVFEKGIIIGEITGGGAHPVKFYPLSNGYLAKIPIGRSISPVTKNNWESAGVTPDISCEEKDALQKALEKLDND